MQLRCGKHICAGLSEYAQVARAEQAELYLCCMESLRSMIMRPRQPCPAEPS